GDVIRHFTCRGEADFGRRSKLDGPWCGQEIIEFLLIRCGALQGQNVRPESPGKLFSQSIIVCRQHAAVQCALQLLDPAMMKMVEYPRINSAPVVDGHLPNP